MKLLTLTLVLSLFSKQIPNQQPVYSVSLTIQQWNVVANCLNESDVLPAKQAYLIINQISSQVNAQVTAAQKKLQDTTTKKKK